MRSSLKMAAYSAFNRAEGDDMRMEGRGYAEGNEAAFRDGRGRRRYDDGRFAPRNEMEGRMEGSYEMDGDMESRRRRMTHDGDMESRRSLAYGADGDESAKAINEPIPIWRSRMANPIGFTAEGGMTSHHGKHGKEGMEHGRASTMRFDHEAAEKWMRSIRNADETVGAHWPLEHIKQVMSQKDIDLDPMEFWVAVNMMYSDYYPVAKAMNMNNIGFYVELAKCFLEDEDAVKDKLAAYYHSVVKH